VTLGDYETILQNATQYATDEVDFVDIQYAPVRVNATTFAPIYLTAKYFDNNMRIATIFG
jgi:hypothetical protein